MHGSMHKGDVLPAALIASGMAWLAHRYIMRVGNIMPPPTFPPACVSITAIWWALPVGLFAGLVSYAFVRARRLLDTLPYPVWARGLILGAIVGYIGLVMPDTLTWGEFQIEILANFRPPLNVGDSTKLAVAKFATIVLTIASGYSAGIVYPLIMIGYLFGPLIAAVLDPNNEHESCLASDHSGGPWQDRAPGVEVISQILGSGVLAGVMRAPVGTALLVSFMGRMNDRSLEPAFLVLLMLTNFVAVYINPLSGLGQVYGREGEEKTTGVGGSPSTKAGATAETAGAGAAAAPEAQGKPNEKDGTGADQSSFLFSLLNVTTARGSMTNWVIFAVAFGFNYGSSKTSISFLTDMFARETAAMANLLTYVVWAVTTLFVTAAAVELSGHPKWCVVVAHIFYGMSHFIYSFQSMCRIAQVDGADILDPWWMIPFTETAGALGGIACALSWTAQGVYFAYAARKHAVLTGVSVREALAKFGALFAGLELLAEALCRLGVATILSGAPRENSHDVSTLHDPTALALLSALCFSGAAATACLDDLTHQTDEALQKSGVANATDTATAGESQAKESRGPQSVYAALEAGVRSGLSSLLLLATSLTALLLQSFSVIKGTQIGLNRLF
jgi:hypothetical protein